jgi:hypothetical protein
MLRTGQSSEASPEQNFHWRSSELAAHPVTGWFILHTQPAMLYAFRHSLTLTRVDTAESRAIVTMGSWMPTIHWSRSCWGHAFGYWNGWHQDHTESLVYCRNKGRPQMPHSVTRSKCSFQAIPYWQDLQPHHSTAKWQPFTFKNESYIVLFNPYPANVENRVSS